MLCYHQACSIPTNEGLEFSFKMKTLCLKIGILDCGCHLFYKRELAGANYIVLYRLDGLDIDFACLLTKIQQTMIAVTKI